MVKEKLVEERRPRTKEGGGGTSGTGSQCGGDGVGVEAGIWGLDEAFAEVSALLAFIGQIYVGHVSYLPKVGWPWTLSSKSALDTTSSFKLGSTSKNSCFLSRKNGFSPQSNQEIYNEIFS